MSYVETPIDKFRRNLMRAASAGIAVSGLVAVPNWTAIAQVPCMTHEELVEFLYDRHDEKRVGAGLETGGRLLEVFATASGSTWTMVVTSPNGASCVVATGLEWQEPETFMPDPET